MENLNRLIEEDNNKIKNIVQNKLRLIETVNDINNILKKFNYTNFKLIENSDHLTYSIVRPDNTDTLYNIFEEIFKSEKELDKFLKSYKNINGEL